MSDDFDFLENMLETTGTVAPWPVLHRCQQSFLQDQVRHFILFGDSGTEMLFITADDRVLVAGNNTGWPSLPVGHRNSIRPDRPEQIPELFRKKIIVIQSGQRHVMALSDSGQLYAWGDNRFGQLGTATRFESTRAILAGEQISKIACGANHTVALTANTGQVFAWGRNNYGQIGIGHNNDQMVPVKISALDRFHIRAVYAGHSHSLALTDDGQLFAWGANSYGQLGIGNCTHQTIPIAMIKLTGQVQCVAAGESHTLILLTSGEILACGRNHRYQLGKQVSPNEGSCVPIRIWCTSGFKFQSIWSHWSTSFSMATTVLFGYCFVWGDCRSPFDDRESIESSSSSMVCEPRQTPLIRPSDCFALYCPRRVTPGLVSVIGDNSPEMIGNRIINRLARLFNDPITADVQMMVDGKKIYAHRWFLQLTSQYLSRMLANEWNEERQPMRIITITQYSYKIFYSYIQYLYTDRLELFSTDGENDDNLWFEMLDLAHCYLDDDLKNRCLAVMYDRMAVENCCHHYQLALRYQLNELESAAITFFRRHLFSVVRSESFRAMPDDQCKTLLIAAVDSDDDQEKEIQQCKETK